MKKWICLFLLFALSLQLSACTQVAAAQDLMQDIAPNKIETRKPDAVFAAANAEFSLSLLRNSYSETQTVLLSPYSALMALAMTANGAQGQTLAQMETAFGLPIGTLNAYLAAEKESEELHNANSLWIREGFPAEQDFLQTNADYYGADIYRAPFHQQTADDINAWVKENTNNRIDKIIDSINPESMLYLLNALSFDAKWATPYKSEAIHENNFTAANGEVQTVDMLYSAEHNYLETDDASGFLKYYKGGRYCFFALLPNADVSMQEFLQGLDGETLSSILHEPEREEVHTSMPKLKIEYAQSLNDALMAMGITDAFSPNANFSGMSSKPLRISSVTQKVYWELDEQGTKAAAATITDMMPTAAAEPEEPKVVHLNRPYVMGIYDRDSQCILFFGVVNTVSDA